MSSASSSSSSSGSTAPGPGALPSTVEVVVMGGGPAGSTVASLLARLGHEVLLLEREEFPRFRIGESLMPATYWTFQRLGVLDKLHAAGFVQKASVQFFSQNGRAAAPFYFEQIEPGPSGTTWQVDRGRFDKLLLDHAASLGVHVHTRVAVNEVLFAGSRAVGVRAQVAGGVAQEIAARVVVDATGQNALLSRRLGLKQVDPQLRHMAFFTRYAGAVRDPGIDAGATLIMHTENRDSWFWYIPLPGDVVSVGVVGHIDYLLKPGATGGKEEPQAVFDAERRICLPLGPRLAAARQLEPVQVLRDFSYTSRQIAGDGWVLAGDAFGFLDPIYSSGVFLAFKSAEFAADSIHEALTHDDLSAARLGRHGSEFIQGMEALRRLAYAYYDRNFSFARFLKKFPGTRDDLVHLLIGNVYRQDCSGFLEAIDGESRPPGYQPLHLPAEPV